jgi:hypothetical protein
MSLLGNSTCNGRTQSGIVGWDSSSDWTLAWRPKAEAAAELEKAFLIIHRG